MYYRYFNQIYRPVSLGINRIPIRNFKTYDNTKSTYRVPATYKNDVSKNLVDSKKERDERRREAITHVYFNPSFTQKLLIMKTRFLATGWITLVFIILTYLGVKLTIWFGNWTHRDRYSL